MGDAQSSTCQSHSGSPNMPLSSARTSSWEQVADQIVEGIGLPNFAKCDQLALASCGLSCCGEEMIAHQGAIDPTANFTTLGTWPMAPGGPHAALSTPSLAELAQAEVASMRATATPTAGRGRYHHSSTGGGGSMACPDSARSSIWSSGSSSEFGGHGAWGMKVVQRTESRRPDTVPPLNLNITKKMIKYGQEALSMLSGGKSKSGAPPDYAMAEGEGKVSVGAGKGRAGLFGGA